MTGFAGRITGGTLDARPAAEQHEGLAVLYRGYIANAADAPAEFARAFRRWGEGLQSRVLGEYAVALFDPRTGELFLTHDALGLAPVFYAETPGGLAFASCLRDLAPLAPDQPDEEYIADYLATCSALGTRTPYRGIRRLLPGQSLRWNGRHLRLSRTWDIARVPEVTLGSDAAYQERLRTLLREGVKAAMRSEGKVWSELSGGLDSSTVTSLAAQSGAGPLDALSITYTLSASSDEREWMQAVVRRYGLRWHTIDGDESKPFSELPDAFAVTPLDAMPTAGILRRYNALAKSNGVRVILTGHGGDQVLCGDSPKPHYLADLLPFHLARLRTALREWQAADPNRRSLMFHLSQHVLRPRLRYWTRRSLSGTQTTSLPPWISPDYRRTMHLDRRSHFQPVSRCRSVGQQGQAERIWRVGMSAWDGGGQPFDLRFPLLYRPLVEFMLGIPWEQKLRPDCDRYLHRRAMTGILPEEVRLRTDKAGPEEAQFEGLRKDSPWLDLLLTRPRVVERGYVDARRWSEAVNQARFGRIVSMRHFIAAATLEVWLRQREEVRGARHSDFEKGELVYVRS
jgi:asparagine synthase (glutamine-hydrolysing)